MDRCTLLCVDPAQAPEIWPQFETALARAFAKCQGDESLQDARNDVLSGNALLWLVTESDHGICVVLITKVFETAKGRTCQIVALTGAGVHRWACLLPQLEQYARDMQCKFFRVSGRKGWRHVLPAEYTEPYVTLERTL